MNTLVMSFILMPLFLFTIISPITFTSYASHVSYRDHCTSMVPKSTPNQSKFKAFPYGQHQHGYYIGGGNIYPKRKEQKHVEVHIKRVYETDVDGILNIEAWLIIQSATWYYRVQDGNYTDENWWNYNQFPSFVKFRLEGFWSESSGKLCMVGTEIGDNLQLQRLEVVLKLYNVVNSKSTISTLVTGSLESMSSGHEVSYFEPLSLFIFPIMDYEYTLGTKDTKNEYADEGGVEPGLPINPVRLCSVILPMINGIYALEYQSECKSAKNCSPIGDDANQLLYIVSLKALLCSNIKQRVKVLVGFGELYYGSIGPFNPNATLVGEGWWDLEKNQLNIVACHFLGMEKSIASVHVGDCSTRISLRFPKIWSINDASFIVGEIWSNNTVGDSGYFKSIVLRSHRDKRNRVCGTKYEYRKLDKVRKLCPRQKPLNNKGIRYPDVYSSDMRIDFGVEYYDQVLFWGYSEPFAVNDQIQELNSGENFVSKTSHIQPVISTNSSSAELYNVSYEVSLSLAPNAKFDEENSLLNSAKNATEAEINLFAEGIYDAEAGNLCMVGCRNLGSQNQIPRTDSVDCEILVKFQFQQLKANKDGAYIKGSIESTRTTSDPLYFNPLNLTSIAYYTIENKPILRKEDTAMIMILMCTTLAFVFVAVQLYHVKRNPDMLPIISFVMLLILTLGNVTSLVLNFHSLFAQNHYSKKNLFSGNNWLELNQIATRLIATATFVLQLHLLKLTWSARNVDRNHKGLWNAEKKVLYVIFPLYAAGFLYALPCVPSSGLLNYHKYLLWEYLTFYSGLVLDGFLLPQILLNMFWNSKGNALSCSLLFGTSLVGVLPRAFDDLYDALIYVVGSRFDKDYEMVEYHYRAWDKIIPVLVLMFSVIVYVQQMFGGRSILFWRIQGKDDIKIVSKGVSGV